MKVSRHTHAPCARRRLWLKQGSETDRRLLALLDERLASGTDDFQLPRVMALVAWEPETRARG
ncbi:MAG TPA: hypothetical protein VMM78_14015 [Thermomicrobiales bacterium]|nr:hypothetical protein [Thermomicrobiales bacterium]